jgi:hypothetical protein
VTSPGELKDVASDWVLNSHSVCTGGETILGLRRSRLEAELTATQLDSRDFPSDFLIDPRPGARNQFADLPLRRR